MQLFSQQCVLQDKFPSSCLSQRKAYHLAVHASLGLLMNATLEKTDAVKSSSLAIAKAVLPYLDKAADIQERAVGCLSHVLPVSNDATLHFITDKSR